METKLITPFKVGFVLLAGIITAVIMITRFGDDLADEAKTRTIYADFGDATGLAEKSQVRIAGIDVGFIDSIQLVDNKARVSLRISREVDLWLGEGQIDGSYLGGATISKKLSNLLGDYYLEVTPGTPGRGREMVEFDEIKNVIEALGPEAILAEVNKITQDVSQITGTLAEVFGGSEGQQKLARIVSNVEEITDKIRVFSDESNTKLNKILDDVNELTGQTRGLVASSTPQVRQSVENLERFTRTLDRIARNTEKDIRITFVGLNSTLEDADEAIGHLDESLEELERISKGVSDGRGSVGKLLADDELVNEATALVKDTRDLIANTEELVDSAGGFVESITGLETYVNLRNDYMVGFNAFKNVLSVRLQPNPDKWYLIELVSDPRGKSSTVRRVVDASGAEPTFEEVTTTTREFKFSFQFAGRYEWVAGRFGIIENSGGLGGNVYFLDDTIEIVADLYDFSFGEYPRLRAFGLIYFNLFLPDEWGWSENIYLSGGIDDPFNVGTFDYFAGLGITFNDKDLKALLTVAPVPSP